MVSSSGQGGGLRCGPTPAPALRRVPILKQRARGPLAWAGTRGHEQAGDRVRQQRSAGKRQKSTDTVAASSAAGPTISSAFEQPTLPSPTRKTGSTVNKEAENPIYVLSAFCGGSGTWIPCPYCLIAQRAAETGLGLAIVVLVVVVEHRWSRRAVDRGRGQYTRGRTRSSGW